MFDKLLIANRGEIACRIIRTAKRLGIRTVAVCSDVDTNALHVELADEAQFIGKAPARESYLNIDVIVKAALSSGAKAIHPGYGFLSENAQFAQACAEAGLVFVGPPVSAIRAMGSKSEAKTLMQAAKVPLVPGYHGVNQNPDFLLQQAIQIGFPVLIKASAGGGGKGMKIVENEARFGEALASAKRESSAAFGDDRVLLEKYLLRPRHIEMQIFADSHGNYVHLFERDCSIQRRHQKVIEEAPAPNMGQSRRREMGEAAILAAKAVNYEGAGTVEFIVNESGEFYFMEMNTRLQVEHPVTEMISGQDLVEWQLRVASGEALPLTQDKLEIRGHAIEVRLYAEDPARDFLPSTGHLDLLRLPDQNLHIRVDSGVRTGDTIGVHYDPMLAKVIAWGADRKAAIRQLSHALANTRVAGPHTNRDFLLAIAAHPAFAAAELDTGFIDRHKASLQTGINAADDTTIALASLYLILEQRRDSIRAASLTQDPHSPWAISQGFRLNLDGEDRIYFQDGPRKITVPVVYRPGGFHLSLPGSNLRVNGELDENGNLLADLGGRRITATVIRRADELNVMSSWGSYRLTIHDPGAVAAAFAGAAGHLRAPMPGKIVQVFVESGQKVTKGTTLVILEAMKMEHAILAPVDGVIKKVHYETGNLVNEGAELVSFAEQDAESVVAEGALE